MPTNPLWTIEWTNVYQIVWKQSYISGLIVNRSFYVALGEPASGLPGIANLFKQVWVDNVLPLQSDSLNLTNVVVTQMYGERAFYDLTVTGQPGQDNGADLPGFFGIRLQLVPERTRVRKGRKIIGGICEEAVDGNNIAGAYAARVATLCAAMEDTYTLDDVDFQHVLLSPANTKHAADIMTFVVACNSMGFSTQGSRKLGRGA
jgi:hypothetical protein